MKRKPNHAPIPTLYNGVTYRSRLEAKWQVFFDELDFETAYEDELVFNDDGEILYVPDFVVYSGIKCRDWTSKHYIEIKPVPPNQAYLNRLKELPLPMHVDILVCVGPPNFKQKNGSWIMHVDANQRVIHNQLPAILVAFVPIASPAQCLSVAVTMRPTQ